MTVIGKPADLVEFVTLATGTGDITGNWDNLRPNRLTPWEAGLRTGDKVTLRITDGDNIEISECTCIDMGTIDWGFTRDTVRVSKVGDASAATDKITLSGSAIVAVVQASDDFGGIRYKEVDVSSADLLQAFTSPKELLAAPGANNIIIVEKYRAFYTYGTTTYTSTTNLTMHYAGGNNYAIQVTGFGDMLALTESGVDYGFGSNDLGAISWAFSEMANKALVLSAGQDLVDGDGTLKIFLEYRIIENPWA